MGQATMTTLPPWQVMTAVEISSANRLYLAERRRQQVIRMRRAWRNRVVVADRLRWPEGVLRTCEDLDSEFPGWFVHYCDKDIGWSRRGYHAFPWDGLIRAAQSLFAWTGEGMRQQLVKQPVAGCDD
jgi:hypothetical protein